MKPSSPAPTPPLPSVECEGLKITLSQEEDTFGRSGQTRQTMDLDIVGGSGLGGFYVVINTERWAFDDEAEWQDFWRRRIAPALHLAEDKPDATAPAPDVPAKKPARALAVGTDLEAALRSLTNSLVSLPAPDHDGRQPMTLVKPADLRLALVAIERFRDGNGAIVS